MMSLSLYDYKRKGVELAECQTGYKINGRYGTLFKIAVFGDPQFIDLFLEHGTFGQWSEIIETKRGPIVREIKDRRTQKFRLVKDLVEKLGRPDLIKSRKTEMETWF